MDYEKAYKESFEVAQCLHEAGDTTTKKQMERLFPQLAESDDYRNWKKVKRAIRIFFTNPTESNELLAWLEKQKEQKQVECIDFDNEFENQVSHLVASILNGEHEYNEGFVKYAAQSLLGYAKSEMKPDEWDKREKLFMKALQTANTQIGQLFEENKKLKEQKPIEWSDEDEEMHVNVASSLRVYACGLENEEHKKHIKKEIDWFENRFKFLRPQPYWKPTEEQMKALEEVAYNLVGTSTDTDVYLVQLYEQLKKLM